MDKIKGLSSDFVGNMKNPKSMTFIVVIAVIVVFIIIVIINSAVRYHIFNKKNPRFFKKGKDAKKREVIKGDKFENAYAEKAFSLFTWLYVDNMAYNYGKWKHVLTKGNWLPHSPFYDAKTSA